MGLVQSFFPPYLWLPFQNKKNDDWLYFVLGYQQPKQKHSKYRHSWALSYPEWALWCCSCYFSLSGTLYPTFVYITSICIHGVYILLTDSSIQNALISWFQSRNFLDLLKNTGNGSVILAEPGSGSKNYDTDWESKIRICTGQDLALKLPLNKIQI